VCGSAAECFRFTRDVRAAVRLMVDCLRAPDLLNAGWVAPWLAPGDEGRTHREASSSGLLTAEDPR
jgi:hypothetical protein